MTRPTDGRADRPHVSPRSGLRRAGAAIYDLVQKLSPASLDEIVEAVRETKTSYASRRVIAVRVTNLHRHGYLRRTGSAGNYRYSVVKL